MGAVVNLRPDLFHGVVAAVPFVDVVTTMLDDTIPLTTFEYEEWGNPHQKEYYDYMLSYSPYDNVEAKRYPNLLVTTGLQDSQVQYWEPAKWVARLRALKTDKNRLLLYTNMGAGHGGATGRFKRHRETAMEYAFLLDALKDEQAQGITIDTTPPSALTLALGRNTTGASTFADLAKMPHLLIAGATGAGKSVGLNGMITSILYKATPADVRFIMIDTKMIELGMYAEIPHLLIPVVTDPKHASTALNAARTAGAVSPACCWAARPPRY